MSRTTSLTLIAAFALLGGCQENLRFPFMASADKHVYHSTAHVPYDIALVDTVTRETLWELKIPVNHKAVIQFKHGKEWTATLVPATPAEEIRWGIFPADMDTAPGPLQNIQKLPGNPVMMKVSIRDRAAVGSDDDCCDKKNKRS